MLKATRFLAALFALLLVANVRAAPIEFHFTGVITSEAINGCGVTIACGTFSGTYSFDSAAADLNPDGSFGLFSGGPVTFAIDGGSFTYSSGTSFINVVDSSFDQYGLLALGGTASDGSIADFSLLMTDFAGAVFASDALPLAAGALLSLLPGDFTLFALGDVFQLAGTIDSISCTVGCGGGTEVPEPPVLLLLATGLVALWRHRLRVTVSR